MTFLKRLFLFPLRVLYQGVISLRNFLFDQRFLRINSFQVPVISIGNLSAGGTGKTPLIMYLLDLFVGSSKKLAVVTRGYGRKSSGQVVVSDGAGKICSVEDGGDEPVLIAKRYPQAVVIANAKRTSGIKYAIEQFHCDLILLDDAYQHRFVQRNCDIVLFNAAEEPDEYVPLPQGRLREPLRNIRRADIVVITKGNETQQKRAHDLVSDHYAGPLYTAEFKTDQLIKPDFSPASPKKQIKNEDIVAFCGIAHANDFFETLKKSGARVQKIMHFMDHHFYTQSDISFIQNETRKAGCRLIVTTEKDLVRINPALFTDFELLAPRLTVQIDDQFAENVRTFIDKGISN
jgi:tetraacyldisaccharide 4'-kinase